MSTKYFAVEAPAPSDSDQGLPGKRKDTVLKSIFHNPFKEPGTVAAGNFPSTDKGEKGDAVAVTTDSDTSYAKWFYDNVVNGVIESSFLVDSAGGNSSYSMNYVKAPSLKLDDSKSLEAEDGNGKSVIVATNQFVPSLIVQYDTHGFPVPPSEEQIKPVRESINKKSSFPPGSGPTLIASQNSSNDRDPSQTSAKTQAGPKMVLGQFVKAAAYNPPAPPKA